METLATINTWDMKFKPYSRELLYPARFNGTRKKEGQFGHKMITPISEAAVVIDESHHHTGSGDSGARYERGGQAGRHAHTGVEPACCHAPSRRLELLSTVAV